MTALAKVPAGRLRKGAHRLRTRSDFECVRREGKSWAHRLLVLIARPNQLPVTRVGVAAGKKVGSAVVRNRAKRLMREAVRVHAARLSPGYDLLLIARAAIVPVKMQEVADALKLLLQQAGLILK
jgi:ribonuclease P protein component